MNDIYFWSTVVYVLAMTSLVFWGDRQEKKLKANIEFLESMLVKVGYNPDAKDKDGDGIIQEGTKWQRKL